MTSLKEQDKKLTSTQRKQPSSLISFVAATSMIALPGYASAQDVAAPSTPAPVIQMAQAQETYSAGEESIFDNPASLAVINDVHLAYIRTPSENVNNITNQGLRSLSRVLNERTSIEPRGVVGLDIENDELSLYPLIYWPIIESTSALSPAARDKLQSYLDNGGMIIFDLRDTTVNTAENEALQRVLQGISLRQLTTVQPDHTLRRSFYLPPTLRGTFDYQNIWIEQPPQDGSETVTSVIIGENRWVDAWAATSLPRTSRQREMALRSGVNMVFFALTGHYKSDQLHIPSILERLEP